ncbi:lipopolysaccharide biosynthesis protein [Arthrobacter sp. 35W]|uniref:lipopolysaccharide biosynthesis protein n=1 Tax=Arthrobacter sp. 35W TaxID=1132441 RepID=UPI0004296F20|nr:oligosaccharide flippase family protein [Arthrobacter sp. 35W]
MKDDAAAKPAIAGSRSALLYLVGSLLQGLGLLLIQPFAVRVLDGTQWGLVSTAVVTIQVVVVLLSAGLPLAITQRWFAPGNGRDRSLGMYGFMAIACLAIGLAAAAVVAFATGAGGTGIAWTTVLAMVCIGLLGPVLGCQAVLRAQDRPMAFVLLSIGSSVLANLAGLVAIAVGTPTAANYLGAYTAAVLATALLAVVLVRPRAPWTVKGVVGESGRIALPLLPHTGALMLLTQGAVLLLAAVSGPATAGQYGAVLIFATGPLTVLNALNNSWSTRIMSVGRDELGPTLRAVLVEAALSAAAVGMLASAAASVGSAVLTTDPTLLAPVAQVLPLMSVGYAAFLIAGNVVYVLHRTTMMAYLTPAALLLSSGAALVPALAGDLLAVAAAHAAGFTVLGLAYWLAVRAATPGAWPMKVFVLAFAAHAALIVVLLLVPVSLATGLVEAGVVGAGAAAAALLVVKRRRIVEPSPAN